MMRMVCERCESIKEFVLNCYCSFGIKKVVVCDV